MAATETTRFQVNFKTHKDGTLINVYADSANQLEEQIAIITAMADQIRSTEQRLQTGSSSAVANIQAALGATIISDTPAPTPATTQDGFCKHGALVWRESKPGAPKTWKGWFCPSPKGTIDQCEPRFIR